MSSKKHQVVRILFPYTRSQISLSLVGFASTYLLSFIKLTYPYNIDVSLAWIGVFVVACSGGPLLGAVAALLASTQTLQIFAGYDIFLVTTLAVLAGGLSTYIRPLYSTIVSWLIVGLAVYCALTPYTTNLTALYWALTVNTYLTLAGAMIADLAAIYTGSIRATKASAEAVVEKSQELA